MQQEQHVCPVWVGKLMVSSLRRLYQNPDKIIRSFVKEGMKVLEVGPGMGFFSLPIARMVGRTGMLYCIDIQPKMLQKLEVRAKKAGVIHQVETRVCSPESLLVQDLEGDIDFVFLFAVVHEVNDQQRLFKEIYKVMKPGAKVLFAEPKGHVQRKMFEDSLMFANGCGLFLEEETEVNGSHGAILKKKH